MYLWRRLAAPAWWRAHEAALRSQAGNRLAIVERPPRLRLNLEVVCRRRFAAQPLVRRFGASVEKIPKDWLHRFSQAQKSQRLRVGRRLVITTVGETLASRWSPHQGASHLVIPAGAAFGTGEHVTTAMSLRLLEEITREMERGWSMADLGTGSGILALAARRLGAKRVIAIDNDPWAISTAKGNARANNIEKVTFRVADARRWRPPGKIEVIVANLFSELLVETLPMIRKYAAPSSRLILSGILRRQEAEVILALKNNEFRVKEVRWRGKWIAILASSYGRRPR